MYDHIGLKVKDIEASARFYEAALGGVGHVLCSRDASSAGLGPKGEPALWLYLAKNAKGPGTHLAFRADDRPAVDRFFKAGAAAGGRLRSRRRGGDAARADTRDRGGLGGRWRGGLGADDRHREPGLRQRAPRAGHGGGGDREAPGGDPLGRAESARPRDARGWWLPRERALAVRERLPAQ